MQKASQTLIYFDANILVFGIEWHNSFGNGWSNLEERKLNMQEKCKLFSFAIQYFSSSSSCYAAEITISNDSTLHVL